MTSPATTPAFLHASGSWPELSALPTPHGLKSGARGSDLMVAAERRSALDAEAATLRALQLTPRQVCDAEMLMNGAFCPLKGFLNENDYKRVVEEMRLADGTLWPMPVTLDVSKAVADGLKVGERVVLTDEGQRNIAVLTVESMYEPDKKKEAELVFGGDDKAHPAVKYLYETAGAVYVGGRVEGIALPTHFDFTDLRYSPQELRSLFAKLGWTRIVGFQTRNPMHRSHRELTLLAARECKANILVHPVVGMTKPGDVDHYTRVRVYKAVLQHYPRGMAALSLLPLAMRMAGPREAVWHAIIRKNYGCTHFIVGRDHAGPGNNSKGEIFYDPYAAQVLTAKYESEIGIKIVPFKEVVYVSDLDEYLPVDRLPPNARTLNISGTELRRRLFRGLDIPDWFTFPEVIKLLRQSYPPRTKQGFTVFFTGLSGSGKSTIANALRVALLEEGGRAVTLLDGDEVRNHLSTTLGFSKEHRDLNISRIGFVAANITRARGIAICSAIAPYRAARQKVREMVANEGGFVEVHVSTPIETCEERDRKGLYAKARKGLIKGFTGIDDPYEPPEAPELVLDTSKLSVLQSVQKIFSHLENEGYIAAASDIRK